jgi:uncharacterized membrane protein YdjX (TVP38/TMEM64 family)
MNRQAMLDKVNARWILAGGVLVGLVAAVLLLPVQEWIRDVLAWTAANRRTAWVAFAAIYVICCVCFVPALPLTLAAGAIFGLGVGTLLVSVASTLGAFCAFWIGRTVARDWVGRKIQGWPRFRALDRAVQARGFWIVLLTRLSPAFPFVLLNYAYGLTSVRPVAYFFASWIGMLPATVAYVYAGSLAADVSQAVAGGSSTGRAGWVLLALGLVATIAVTILVTRTARGFLDRELKAEA